MRVAVLVVMMMVTIRNGTCERYSRLDPFCSQQRDFSNLSFSLLLNIHLTALLFWISSLFFINVSEETIFVALRKARYIFYFSPVRLDSILPLLIYESKVQILNSFKSSDSF